jgi:tungstate transport system substrate-binding protein
LLLLALSPSSAQAQRAITVASTTSTEQSGLFKHLLPKFTGSTGVEVRVVALGTGQALDIGRRGDADVVFVHDKEAEEKFVADGFGVTRQEVMYNDFVVVGPKSDPAGAAGKDIQAALRRIAAVKAPFVSRGDRSGRTRRNSVLEDAGLDLAAIKGDWYKEIGQGMGPCAKYRLGRQAPTCSLTAAPGWLSRTGATSRFSSKATSACSTSTASCW